MGSLKNSRPKACHQALNPWQPSYWHSLQFLNNRDQDEEEKKEQHDLRKEQRHTRLLAAVMTRPNLAPGHPKSTPRGPPPGKGAGFSCGSPKHWSKDCSGSKSQSTPQKSCLLSKKMGCWKREGPQLLRKRKFPHTSHGNGWLTGPGNLQDSPKDSHHYKGGTMDNHLLGRQAFPVLVDPGVTYCVLASNLLGPLPLKPALFWGSKESKNWNISPPLQLALKIVSFRWLVS